VHLHISEAPPRLTELRPDVPPHLATAIARAMSKSPQNRFPTMEDFAAAVGGGEALGTTGATTTTRVLAADDQELDRVLDRVLTGKRRGLTASLHRRASWIAAATLMLAGLGVTAAWVGATHDSSRGERSKGGGSRTTVPTPRAVDPAPKRPTKPVSKPVSKPAEPTVTQAGAPASRRTAMLSVTSSPKATLYLDGRRIGETPLSNHALTVGRTYQVRLERKGYRTKRETITPADARAVRRSYTLKRDTRR